MKVKHLIRELRKCDPEAEVETEGCDCVGDTISVTVESDGIVLINRSPYSSDYSNGNDTPRPLGK